MTDRSSQLETWRRLVPPRQVALVVSVVASLTLAGGPSLAQDPGAGLDGSPEVVESEDTAGWLGFRFEIVHDGEGLKVVQLAPGAAMARAGVTRGEVVTAINGVPFTFLAPDAVTEGLAWIKAGDTVTITLERAENYRDVEVTADPVPAALSAARQRHADTRHGPRRQLGGPGSDAALRAVREASLEGPIRFTARRSEAGELTIQTKPWLDAPAEGLLALLGVAGTLERGETIAGTIENEGETGIRVVLEDRPRNDD